MAKNKEFDETYPLPGDPDSIGWGDAADESGDSGESGGEAGGSSGKIEFHYRDPLALGPRDDLLPPEEMRRLLVVHEDQHKYLVTQARDLRKERKARQEGKHTVAFRNQQILGGSSGGMESFYKKHHISDKFSGIRDAKVISVPSDYQADTNPEMKDQLENRLENRLQLANRPHQTPKLRPM